VAVHFKGGGLPNYTPQVDQTAPNSGRTEFLHHRCIKCDTGAPLVASFRNEGCSKSGVESRGQILLFDPVKIGVMGREECWYLTTEPVV